MGFMNKFLKHISKTIKATNNIISNFKKNNLVILKEGDYFAFHATSKNVNHLLNKKRHKQAQEVFTLGTNNVLKLKNYLHKVLSASLIKDGSNLYNTSIYQIIDCIKESGYACYYITKSNKPLGNNIYDASGSIIDELKKMDIEMMI